MRGQCLVNRAGVMIADGPTVRIRRARHAIKNARLGRARVRRSYNAPRTSVPLLDEGSWIVGLEGKAGGPAIGCRGAGHRKKFIALCLTRIWRWHDQPRAPIPMLEQCLKSGTTPVVTPRPAVRRRRTGDAAQKIVLRGAAVGRGGD